jgi:hypothetical protein
MENPNEKAIDEVVNKLKRTYKEKFRLHSSDIANFLLAALS